MRRLLAITAALLLGAAAAHAQVDIVSKAVPTAAPSPTVAPTPTPFAILTSATMTMSNTGQTRDGVTSFAWTNAMVVALGGTTAGDIKVCTLPAKTEVKNLIVGVTGVAAGVTTLTVSCGRTSAAYTDYIGNSDAKTGAIYGDSSGERGANNTGYDVPNYSGAVDVFCHFVSTGANLSAVTGSTGLVVIEAVALP